MEVWLIRNGKKSGPFHDYDVRSKIGDGDLDADDPAWHEGLAAWTPLGEIDLFKGEFTKTAAKAGAEPVTPPELPDEYLKRAASAKGEKPQAHLARRFWGRWLDLSVYAAIWWLGMYFAGRDIAAAMQNPWLHLLIYMPWFVVEPWLIHRFGTTPGKWLMGLRVRNEDGSKLELKPSIWRSVRVMVTGIGFGWGLLAVLCQAMSWFTTKRIGKPIWDYLGEHKVEAVELNPLKVMALIFGFFGAMILFFSVMGPHLEKEVLMKNPEMAESYELLQRFYLPVKE